LFIIISIYLYALAKKQCVPFLALFVLCGGFLFFNGIQRRAKRTSTYISILLLLTNLRDFLLF